MIILPKDKKLRYERKYMISIGQAEQLRLMLDAVCFKDENVNEEGQYSIRSLYFDDYHGSAYNDNEIGVDLRSKYRIRSYNYSGDYISLERKVKVGGKIAKDRAVISRRFYDAVLQDEVEQLDYPDKNTMINCFLTAFQTSFLRPAVIVDYVREPYVYPDGDVRITFDKDIAFSDRIEDFFDKDLFLQPILPEGRVLLEVKYTEYLPEFIHKQLDCFNLQQCTFSKYYLCEKYKRMGEYI